MNKWNLEDMELYLEVGKQTNLENDRDSGVLVEGLYLEGASLSSGNVSEGSGGEHLTLSSDFHCSLPVSRLVWRQACRKHAEDEGRDIGGLEDRPEHKYSLFPIYLDSSRMNLVTEVLIHSPNLVPRAVWLQRGTAFILRTSV